jgi:hypothetical protein
MGPLKIDTESIFQDFISAIQHETKRRETLLAAIEVEERWSHESGTR